MKNKSNTQERQLNLTESKLPNKPPFLMYLWLLIIGVGLLSIAISSVAIVSLTNTGRVDKDPTKQTTMATQKPDGSNWWSTIVLLGAGVASAGAIYKWRHKLSSLPKRGLTRRQQRKLSLKQGEGTVTTTEIAPVDNSLLVNLETAPEPFTRRISTCRSYARNRRITTRGKFLKQLRWAIFSRNDGYTPAFIFISNIARLQTP